MNVDLAGAAHVAALAFAAVALVLLLAGVAMSLLVRLTAGGAEPLGEEKAPVASASAAEENALRARAAAAAVAVALARQGGPAPSAVQPSPMSPWQIALRTAALTRWRQRR